MNFVRPIKTIFLSLICILVLQIQCECIDNAHYYKPPYFQAMYNLRNRDRVSCNSKNWLAVFDFQYGTGSTHRANDRHGDRTDTFDLYGNHNILYLTKNVPMPTGISPTLRGYITALDDRRAEFETANPADKQCFGQVKFGGKFEVEEFIFNYRQNFVADIFTNLNIPIRHLESKSLCLHDQSPVGSGSENFTQKDPAWINFRDNLNEILGAYCFERYCSSSKRTGLGDISLLLGWEHRFWSPTNFLNYLHFIIKSGALFPTGKARNFSEPFAIEIGYNRHFGIPVRADLILGLSSDICIGTYIGSLFFFSKSHCGYPVRTSDKQNGFIKFYRANVKEKEGTLFDAGAYLKLDHFFKGLSALVGYSYNQQRKSSLTLDQDTFQTNNSIIGNDARLKRWSSHVVHVLGEYDFGVHEFFKKKRWQPHVSIFYNYPFDGKRIFVTPLTGGDIGVEFSFRCK